MTFEKTKIQVLIEEHSRMPLDHHNLPTAAKDCPLCKKATMTTEEKKRTYKQTLALVKKMQKKLSAPPETGREWEERWHKGAWTIEVENDPTIGDGGTHLEMDYDKVEAFIRSVEAKARAEERERFYQRAQKEANKYMLDGLFPQLKVAITEILLSTHDALNGEGTLT